MRKICGAAILALMCITTAGAEYETGQRAWDAGQRDAAIAEWQAGADAGEAKSMLAWERGECGVRVLRGGSWGNRPGLLRSAFRVRSPADNRGSGLGSRIASFPALLERFTISCSRASTLPSCRTPDHVRGPASRGR